MRRTLINNLRERAGKLFKLVIKPLKAENKCLGEFTILNFQHISAQGHGIQIDHYLKELSKYCQKIGNSIWNKKQIVRPGLPFHRAIFILLLVTGFYPIYSFAMPGKDETLTRKHQIDLNQHSNSSFQIEASDEIISQIKWHPGHYLFAGDAPALLEKIRDKEKWKGIKIGIGWREMEPDESTSENRIYDFSELRAAYNEAASAGKYLIVKISYKAFNSKTKSDEAAPKWVYDKGGVAEYSKGAANSPIDFTRIWVPWVREAFVDLLTAIASEFDDLPYFEGIMFPETASSSVGNHDDDYTKELYKDALINDFTDAKAVFVKSNVWQMGNHDIGYSGLFPILYQALYEAGAGMGGPDTYMRTSDACKDELPNWVGKVPLACDQQRPQQLFKGFTAEDVFLRVTETWPLNHVMWYSKEDIVPTSGSWGEKWGFTEVDAMLNNPPKGYPPFYIHDTLPENLSNQIVQTGIKDIKLKNLQLNVFSDSAQATLTIGVKGWKKSAKLKLYTVDGIKVFESSSDVSFPNQLDVSSFKSGVYIVEVSDNGDFIREKTVFNNR